MRSQLTFGVDGDGHLVISPAGGRRLASLRLREEGADLLYAELEPVTLAWDAYGRIRWVPNGPPSNGWAAIAFENTRSGPFGLAVQVSGAYDQAAHEMFRATMPWWRRFNHWSNVAGTTGHVIPILATHFLQRLTRSTESSTVGAVLSIVSRRKELRRAFSDPSRMYRLAGDLGRGMLPTPVEHTGVTRDAVDIINAMHRTGLVHPFGRPLGDKSLPTLEDAVARTRDRLNANPYRQGRMAKDELIVSLVKKEYLEVEPWPFAALFD